MNNKQMKINPLHIQIIITVILFLCVLCFFYSANQQSQLNIGILCWFNTIAFIIQIRLLKSIVGTYVNPVVLFSCFLFMFSSGHLILYSLGIKIEGFNIFDRLDHGVLQYAILYIILGYSIYQLGVIFGIRKNNLYKKYISSIEEKPNKILFTVGVVFFIIGFFPYMTELIYSFMIVSTSGYSAYYQEGIRLNNLFTGLKYYIFTGIILIVTGGKEYQKKLAIIFLVFIAFIRLLSGDRGDGIVFILTAYMLYLIFLRKGKQKSLQTIILVIILMSLVPIIGSFRHFATMNNDINIVTILLENNIFVSTLTNLGATIWPLAKIMEIVPLYEKYLVGGSYFASFLLLIPSFMRLGFLAEIDKVYTSPAGWLMEYLSMSYGPGFTPFAESYLNFGWVGVLFMGVFGFFIAKILSLRAKNEKDIPLMIGLSILCFLLFAMGARGSFNYIVAFFLRYVFIPYLLIRVIEYRYIRKQKKIIKKG